LLAELGDRGGGKHETAGSEKSGIIRSLWGFESGRQSASGHWQEPDPE
jgi:hypothetical protein